jgi:RNA polymerase sigma-70 factor (ECF subfamily)
MRPLRPTHKAGLRRLDADRLGDHLDRLYRSARAITGSAQEAEDLVSETMVRVLARPRRVSRDDELPYLLRAVRNTWADTLRSRSRRPVSACPVEDIEHEDATAGRRAHASAEAREVLEVVAGLPDGHREAIMLVDVAGLSYGEAARTLGVPVGTVMSRLSRGRSAVASRFQPLAA